MLTFVNLKSIVSRVLKSKRKSGGLSLKARKLIQGLIDALVDREETCSRGFDTGLLDLHVTTARTALEKFMLHKQIQAGRAARKRRLFTSGVKAQ